MCSCGEANTVKIIMFVWSVESVQIVWIVENVINEINEHNDLNEKWSGRADLNGRSGRLTNSPAWQRVAPYSSRRHPPAPPQELGHSIILFITLHSSLYLWSGRADLNGRPPAPKAGALTRLRYAPILNRLSRLSGFVLSSMFEVQRSKFYV